MATAVKTWVFASDAEGLVDAGNSASLGFAYEGSDGNGAGCVKFTQSMQNAGDQTEYARRAATGETWEDWGVPAGATVTQVQITGWDERLVSNNKLSNHSLDVRVINSGGTTVHSAGDLLGVSLGTGTDSTWQSGGAGTQRAVDASYQASDTDVRLMLIYQCDINTGAGSDVDQRFDNIELTIVYTAGGTTYYESVAGAVTWLSGGLARRPGVGVSGLVSPSGAAVKRPGKALAGTVSPGGGVLKGISRALAGAVGAVSGAVSGIRTKLVSLAGTVGAVAGSLARRPEKALDGAVTPSGEALKRISRALYGAVGSVSGAVAGVKTLLVALVGSVSSVAGGLGKRPGKVLVGTVSSSGGVLKRISRMLVGAMGTISGAVTGVRTMLVSLAGAIAPAGAMAKQIGTSLAGAVSPAGGAVKRIGRALGGAVGWVATALGVLVGEELGEVAVSVAALANVAVSLEALGTVAVSVEDVGDVAVSISPT